MDLYIYVVLHQHVSVGGLVVRFDTLFLWHSSTFTEVLQQDRQHHSPWKGDTDVDTSSAWADATPCEQCRQQKQQTQEVGRPWRVRQMHVSVLIRQHLRVNWWPTQSPYCLSHDCHVTTWCMHLLLPDLAAMSALGAAQRPQGSPWLAAVGCNLCRTVGSVPWGCRSAVGWTVWQHSTAACTVKYKGWYTTTTQPSAVW